MRFYTFESVLRTVAVSGVCVGRDDLEFSARSWFLLASDSRRKKGDQRARGIEGFHNLARFVDLNQGDCWPVLPTQHVGHRDAFAGPIKFSAGIQSRKQRLAHVEFLGNGLARARVAERLQPL